MERFRLRHALAMSALLGFVACAHEDPPPRQGGYGYGAPPPNGAWANNGPPPNTGRHRTPKPRPTPTQQPPAPGISQTIANDPAGACVDSINRHRATIGLPPLAHATSLEPCVSQEAQRDSQANTAHSAFGACQEYAQNECPGWSGPPAAMIEGCVQMMWDEGPGPDDDAHGHYLNMTSRDYSSVACGFFTMSDGSVWLAQDYR